ncbi:hypothetical protein SP21_12 [Salmonella phage 21]|nr:hypothetical protein SP21_12 [Salmonella phage 21]
MSGPRSTVLTWTGALQTEMPAKQSFRNWFIFNLPLEIA